MQPASPAIQPQVQLAGGRVSRLVRSRPWLTALVIVVLLGGVGAGIAIDVLHEVSTGPNAFVLASGSTHPDRINYSYRTFDGLVRQAVSLQEGQTLELNYAAEVNKGSLAMELKDQSGISLWNVNVPTGGQLAEAAEVVVPRTGTYQVVVTGLGTGGSFDISWSTK